MSSNSRTMRFWGAALMALVLGALPSLYADEAILQAFINTRDTSPKLTLGRTRSDLTQCIQWAEEYGIPLVAIWSNEGCAHCERLERAMTSEAFRAHALKSGLIICAIFNSDGKGSITKSDPEGVRNGTGYHWCWGYGNNSIYKKISMFPFVRFYWKKDGRQIVDAIRTGDNVDGNVGTDVSTGTMTDSFGTYATVAGKTANKSGLYTIDYMIKMFPGYEPVAINDYAGGEFADGTDTENDRLEIEAGTTNVTVNLVRDAGTASSPATNILTVAYPAGKPAARLLGASTAAATGDTPLIWVVGETNKTVNIPIKSANLSNGDAITLLLKDEKGEGHGTNHIWYVEKEVSSANPLWIGERTKDTLLAGEWTMDLDVALERTAAQSGEAYTLVEFTGALWCPWCRGGENYFLQTDVFKSFVAEKNISLVCLDNPLRLRGADSYGEDVSPKSVSAGPYGKGPTLLRTDVGTSGNTTASGLGYLTRKMISKEDAEAVLQRNHNLGYIGGEYATPDAYRTGYPTFVLLDKSGSIVGRLNYQYGETKDNDACYPFDLAENMIRLTNLLETASATREANRYATLTALSAAVGTAVSVELGINCPEQSVRLVNIPSGTVEFSTATDGVELTLLRLDSVELQRKAADLSAAKTENLSMPTKVATGTNSLSYAFSAQDASASYILRVSAYNGADTKKLGASGLSLQATVTSATVLTPAEKFAEFTPVTDSIALEIEEGTVYKLSGSWQDLSSAFSDNGDGTWTATKSGRVTLSVVAEETIAYQIWRPGSVGFTVASRTVKEKDADTVEEVQVALSRAGGVSGSVTVTVSLDEANTDFVDFEGTPRYEEFAPVTVKWGDGDDFMTNVVLKLLGDNNYDGDGKIALKMSLDDGAAEVGNDTFVLTVTDNDERAPGSAAFVESGIVYCKESAGATVHAVRKTASDGAVSVAVSTTAGTLLSEEVAWGNRNSDAKEVTLTGLEAGKTATLTLKPGAGGVTVPSASRTVKVTAVTDDAPEFDKDTVEFSLKRYVAASNMVLVKEGTFTPGNTLAFTKKTGTLPAGLKAQWDKDANALAISGVPTKAGTFTVAYQVAEKRGSKTVAGLVTEITFSIVDPVTADGDGVVPNPAVAKSRTFKDVMIIGDGKLRGILQLTIPATGRASAKLVCADGTVSLSSKSWSEYYAGTGALTATLFGATKATADWSLLLTAATDGSVNLELSEPDGTDTAATISGDTWSADNTAAAYEGYYTVTLPVASVTEETAGLAPTGSGYLTIKLLGASALKSGKATWAGVLPNGTTISGSVILTEEDNSTYLPVFKSSSKDMVAGVVRILKDAKTLKASGNYRTASAPAECPAMVWRHTEAAGSGASYDATLGVYGGLYDKNDELGTLCEELYNSTDMHLVAEGIDGTSGVSVSEHGIKPGTSNGLSAKLSFNSATGIASGTFKTSTGTAKWRGVVLLGWIDCGCSAESLETTFPFVTGAFFYDNKVTYETSAGKTKTITVKCGGKAKIDCSTTFE